VIASIPTELDQPFRQIAARQEEIALGVQLERLDFPEPEDRGSASLSELGKVEYVEDLIRPGRIHVWAAEEGSGKSYAVDDELGIRLAVAGGLFAGTWQVKCTGPVLYLSEMHSDDDFERERLALDSLGLERAALKGRFFRLSLMTAAGGLPALTDELWCQSITDWLRYRGALLLIVDTATAATQVDPWGKDIQSVFTGLRAMLDSYPALAIVLVVHLKKPQGRGARRLSDVLGEWGRWADIVILQENDGTSLERTRLTVRKRVRRERRIIATKRGGLLVDPVEPPAGPMRKVTNDQLITSIEAAPGSTYAELAERLGVSKDTVSRNVRQLGGLVDLRDDGPRRAIRVFPTAAPPHTAANAPAAVQTAGDVDDRRTAARTYIGAAVHAAEGGQHPPLGKPAGTTSLWDEDLAERATDDDGEVAVP
jgi:hypothetical protein